MAYTTITHPFVSDRRRNNKFPMRFFTTGSTPYEIADTLLKTTCGVGNFKHYKIFYQHLIYRQRPISYGVNHVIALKTKTPRLGHGVFVFLSIIVQL